MIDRLVLFCDFADVDGFDLRGLGVPMEGALDADGRLSVIRHPWESIPSSFESVAFKVHDYTRCKEPRAFVELKASPAKVMQGHNVFGIDDLRACAMAIIEPFAMAYPQVMERLDFSTWDVREVDVTYHSRAESVRHAALFIQACSNISKGQTKARHGYATTIYFGKKNSRIKKLKLYEKWTEVTEHLKKLAQEKDGELRAEVFTPQLVAWAKGLIRWEATVKARWFERRGLPTRLFDLVKVFNARAVWDEATKDVRDAIAGHDMKMSSDDKVEKALREAFVAVTAKGNRTYTKAMNAFRTYRLIKELGYREALRVSSRASFYNHLEMLASIGVSRAALQNTEHGAQVVPMIRYVAVDFDCQIPDWADLKAA